MLLLHALEPQVHVVMEFEGQTSSAQEVACCLCCYIGMI